MVGWAKMGGYDLRQVWWERGVGIGSSFTVVVALFQRTKALWWLELYILLFLMGPSPHLLYDGYFVTTWLVVDLNGFAFSATTKDERRSQ